MNQAFGAIAHRERTDKGGTFDSIHPGRAMRSLRPPRGLEEADGRPGAYSHMIMDKRASTIAAGEFKARCLALLDQVARTGQPLVVTKRGKPVAKLVPIDEPPTRSLRGSVVTLGDVVSPLDDEWEMEK
jgi:prevent-host-death family protein